MGSYPSSCIGGLALFLQPLWFCLCPVVQWSCLGLALPRSSSLMAPFLFVFPWVLPGPFTKGPPILLLTVLWPYILVTLLGLPAMFCLTIPSYLLCGDSLCQHLPWSQLSLKLHIKMSIILSLLFNTVFNFFWFLLLLLYISISFVSLDVTKCSFFIFMLLIDLMCLFFIFYLCFWFNF